MQLNPFENKPNACNADLDVLYEHVLTCLTNKSVPSGTYGANLTSRAFENVLTSVPFNIDPERDGAQVLECLGINKPSNYLGGSGSGSPLHYEDGLLDSLNVCKNGDTGAGKLWLVIHPQCYNDLIKYLGPKIQSLKGRKHLTNDMRQALSIWDTNCAVPHHHKSLLVSPSLLRKISIRYEVLMQFPGDVVYVGTGVLHQVT